MCNMNTEYKMVNNYLNYLKTIRGRTENTIKVYRDALIEFHQWIKEYKNIGKIENSTYKDIVLIDVHNYMSYLENRGNGEATRFKKGNAIKGFFKYLRDKAKIIQLNEIEELELPKLTKKSPVYLTKEESISLINVVREKSTPRFKLRNEFIIVLFLFSGLRCSELVGIELNHIHGDIINIHGKGKKERECFMPNVVYNLYLQYLEERKTHLIIQDQYLFLSKHGNKMDDSAINRMIKKYFKLTGINKEISAHKLRHTAATLFVSAGEDIRKIQEVLGHESIATTQKYTHINSQTLKDTMNNNPLIDMI